MLKSRISAYKSLSRSLNHYHCFYSPISASSNNKNHVVRNRWGYKKTPQAGAQDSKPVLAKSSFTHLAVRK